MSLYLRADPWFEDSTAYVVGSLGQWAGFWIRVPNWRKDFSVSGIGFVWRFGEGIEGGILKY